MPELWYKPDVLVIQHMQTLLCSQFHLARNSNLQKPLPTNPEIPIFPQHLVVVSHPMWQTLPVFLKIDRKGYRKNSCVLWNMNCNYIIYHMLLGEYKVNNICCQLFFWYLTLLIWVLYQCFVFLIKINQNLMAFTHFIKCFFFFLNLLNFSSILHLIKVPFCYYFVATEPIK